MNDRKLMRTGLIGSAVAAVCCFTPLLVLLVSGVGLSAITGWLDYGLFPALFASLGLTAYALYLRAGRPGGLPKVVIPIAVIAFSALIIALEFRYALRISLAAAVLVAGYGIYLRRHAAAPPPEIAE